MAPALNTIYTSTKWLFLTVEIKKYVLNIYHLPGSPWSRLCCEPGCCDIGPGVPPEPGDRSSFPCPPYDNEDEGGLWNESFKNTF